MHTSTPYLARDGRPGGLVAILTSLLLSVSLWAQPKPNIILIYADDQGYTDVGINGLDARVVTPNINQLALDGVRFTRGFVTAPQCVPSRAGVMTGRYQQHYGVEDNSKRPLPLGARTIAERLIPAGYVTGQVGKWHLEAPQDTEKIYSPGAQGFQEYNTGVMNSFYSTHDLNGVKLSTPRNLSDPRFRCFWQTDAAISFIKRHKQEPFFLYLAYYAPHVPLESPEPFFTDITNAYPNLPLQRRQSLAMTAAMDQGIGRIRQVLANANLTNNTLIFYISDNGAPLKEGSWNGSLNDPYNGEKGMLTDGGIRTPFIAAWPGRITPSGTSTPRNYGKLVSSLDVAATAAALAGLPQDNLEGTNLMPYLNGTNTGAPHEYLFWRWVTQAAVRDANWKLILLGPNKKYLFQDGDDEIAANNQAATRPDVVNRLLPQLQTWAGTLTPAGLPSTGPNPAERDIYRIHVDPSL